MTTIEKPRLLCWFSCGAASAVASHEALASYRQTYQVQVVHCDTRASEHPDNDRFCQDVEQWLGQPIVHLRNLDYQTVDDVFARHHYMAGVKGARCTTELKKLPRLAYAHPEDTHVFGFTAHEMKRVREFEQRNPELRLKWVLVEKGLTKSDCLRILQQAGIAIPTMYQLGFDNNNCPGCVKASSPWYWSMVRKHFPEVFQRRAQQSRAIGCRLVEIHHHERIFLDELPEGDFPKPSRKENLSCGPECGLQLNLSFVTPEPPATS